MNICKAIMMNFVSTSITEIYSEYSTYSVKWNSFKFCLQCLESRNHLLRIVQIPITQTEQPLPLTLHQQVITMEKNFSVTATSPQPSLICFQFIPIVYTDLYIWLCHIILAL